MKPQNTDKATARPLQYAILNGVEYSPCKAQPDTQELADASARLMIFHGNRINPESRMWIAPLGEFSSGWVIGTHAKQLVDKEAEHAALLAVAESATSVSDAVAEGCSSEGEFIIGLNATLIEARANLAAVREGGAK